MGVDRRHFRAIFGIVALCAVGAAPSGGVEDAAPLDPRAVVNRTFSNLYGYSSIQRVEVRASQPGGRDYVRRVQVARRGHSEGLNRMLLRFLGPGDMRGVGVLLLERPDFTYDAFLYQPALDKVRRVSVAQRKDPFFGTDVFFEDLESRRPSQWSPHFVREEGVGSRRAWVIELVPQDLPSAYSRIVGWFDLETPVMLRAQFFDEGELLKEFSIDPEEIVEVDGFYVPARWTFRGSRGSETIVAISDIDIRESLPERIFTSTVLQYGDAALDARARRSKVEKSR